MYNHFHCPAVSQHTVLLRVAAFPLVPFRYGLQACALRGCQAADASARHTYFSKGERILGTSACLSLSVRPASGQTSPYQVVFLHARQAVCLAVRPGFKLLDVLSEFGNAAGFVCLAYPLAILRPPGSEAGLSSTHGHTDIVRGQVSFGLCGSRQAVAFVVVSQHVHVGIPFLAMPFQPAHHLFAQVVFLVRFFLYDVPEEYLPVLRLRNVGVQFTEQPDLFVRMFVQ